MDYTVCAYDDFFRGIYDIRRTYESCRGGYRGYMDGDSIISFRNKEIISQDAEDEE